MSRVEIRTAGAADARDARLHYVTDRVPGIRRVRRGRGFIYCTANGRSVTHAELTRIKSLVIPPAWRDVWICADARGHLQATGRDARGRKQHRYHPRWRTIRDTSKFDRLLEFAEALPRLRRAIEKDLSDQHLSRRKVLAAIVQLLERTLIRIGNREYARSNGSFGLTTLRDAHAVISGSSVRLRFQGKSGKAHDIAFSDPRLARIVRRCQELPGRDLFQYLDDDGQVVNVASTDVNEYLRAIMGHEFSAKDFRTWLSTVLATHAFRQMMTPSASSARPAADVNAVVEAVAGILGNTKAVCRKSYIHPAVIDAYTGGTLARHASRRHGQTLAHTEQVCLSLLRQHRHQQVRLSA